MKALALDAGFSRVGIATAHPRQEDQARLETWLDAGFHGDMAWMAKNPARRSDPGLVVDGARSVIVLALDYDTDAPRTPQPAAEGQGWISRYAWGTDYHLLMERRLKAFTRAVASEIGPTLGASFRGAGQPEGTFEPRTDFRWSVDYGPVLERPWAEEAGLGWQGKHSLLVDPERGSFFFLATVITTLDLHPDSPQTDHCGTCTACMDACPTGAIVQERVVDARRCISYLTIETRGALTAEQQAMVGDHVFGCDICQDVCPFNRFSQPSDVAELQPRDGLVAPSLVELAKLDDEVFRRLFRRSPVKRAKIAGLQRNVAAVVGNQARRQAGGLVDLE
ncbi:MAG: tRNA epoxyqueuosine(34) reductase QueG [Myxococcales bacterium]|nr:tRNA epoxyqueuosine(34) reductase QueG [Myxococcales bacterium]